MLRPRHRPDRAPLARRPRLRARARAGDAGGAVTARRPHDARHAARRRRHRTPAPRPRRMAMTDFATVDDLIRFLASTAETASDEGLPFSELDHGLQCAYELQ